MSLQRLTALRALMASQPTALAAYIIPTADAHNSEYIAPVDARREWISGFTGSAGTAVVTPERALLWTDGRYYTQFEKEADLNLWTLMKQSLPDTPTIEKWLTVNLIGGAIVGVDPQTMTREEWTPLQTALSKAKMQLMAIDNLIDIERLQLDDPPPERPHNEIIHLPIEFTGKTAGQKIKDLRDKMIEKKASALVITALDEVAYTLNLRGSDIDYNPVFFSYLVVTPTSVILFWHGGQIPEQISENLRQEGVEIEGKPYKDIEKWLRTFARELSQTGDGEHTIWLSSEASEAIHRAASGEGDLKKPLSLISEVSPVALAKLIKNDVELEGFRQCHIRDGVAVVRFFRWLHDQVGNGIKVTEIQAADKLLEFRKEELYFMGPSFETIPGAGENGAIIHYSPSRDGPQREIGPNDMFLLDSGGQYKDGTTDITRTRHMGEPTPAQIESFTRVLKGQIAVGSALFPKGVKGNVLDSFARKALWDVGLDYAHGTGHGVGHFLNVHEGPSGISWRPYPHDPGLKPGQILSNEPGFYKVGEYGIRHEDLVETISVTKESDHPRAAGLLGDYDGRGVLGFSTITLAPNQWKCIDEKLLNDFELNYINTYHQRVFKTLGPILKERGLEEDYLWLENETAVICLKSQIVLGTLPNYDYGEPDSPIFAGTPLPRVNRQTTLQRLAAVRDVMTRESIAAFVVPTADAHNSQYIAPSDARREWLSGLSGSSGTALVTQSHALVWTDARYFTQFEIQVDTSVWSLMRQGTDLSIQDWLVANMAPNSVVGIDPTTYTRNAWAALETALAQVNVRLQAVNNNVVDQARTSIEDPPPPRPNEPLLPLPVTFTGRVSSEKITDLLTQIRARNAAALVLTALDDIAYTLNLRGSDIPFNPVFFSYLVIRTDQETNNIVLFWGDGQLTSDIQQHLTSERTQIQILPYNQAFQYLRDMSQQLGSGQRIWLAREASQAVYLAAQMNEAVTIFLTVSPVALMKCVKNDIELQGFRSAHIKDGLAVVRFLRWVHEQVDAGVNVTEINVVDKLDELRSLEQFYRGPSFATIAGAGENGAIIHYKPSREGEPRVVRKDDMLLVDSGGQYMDGTTDITRTRHMSSPTAAQRLAFTRVLKGQILLGTAVFPRGSTGNVLETLARKALWDVGLNYAHGTGHGVGHFLNVHEGPSGISAALMVGDPGIVPGMIFSNEPGFYEVGAYGIRHEDLMEVIEMNRNADHVLAEGLVGNFSGVGVVAFRTISLAPHQVSSLDISLLNDHEIRYLNSYHARVFATLGPILKERNLTEDYEWLEKECAAIRSAAILFKLSPFLFISVFSSWFTA